MNSKWTQFNKLIISLYVAVSKLKNSVINWMLAGSCDCSAINQVSSDVALSNWCITKISLQLVLFVGNSLEMFELQYFNKLLYQWILNELNLINK